MALKENMSYFVHLDWITFSGKYPDAVKADPPRNQFDARAAAVGIISNVLKIRGTAFNNPSAGRFYDWSWTDDYYGVRVHISSRSEQGWMVELPGRFFRENEIDHQQLINDALTWGAKITRLDVAVDLFNTPLLPQDIYLDMLTANLGEFKRKVNLIHGKNGDTLSLGSRQSQFFMRVYDKAGEQQIDGLWLRSELEIKDDAAAALPRDIQTIYRRAAAKMLDMLGCVENDLTETLTLVSGGLLPLGGKVREDTTDTERWFLHSVVPALKKLKQREPSTFDRVRAAVLKELL